MSCKDLNSVYSRLIGKILSDFSDIVVAILPRLNSFGRVTKLRIILKDKNFIDVRWHVSEIYSIHWERRHINGTIFRYDNAPHHVGIKNVSTSLSLR